MHMGDGGRLGGWERLTMRSASALRFSKGCSSLNLDRMVGGSGGEMCVCGRERCICSGRVRSCCVDVDVDVVL